MYLEMLYSKYGNALEKQASQVQRKQIEKKAAKAALKVLKSQLGEAGKAMHGVGSGIGGLGKALFTQGQNLAKVKGERLLQGLNTAKLWGKNKLDKLEQYIVDAAGDSGIYGARLAELAKSSPARTALIGGGLFGTGVGAAALARYIRENNPNMPESMAAKLN